MDALTSSPPQPAAPAEAPLNSSHPDPASSYERASAAAGGVISRPANYPASQDDRQLHNSQESILSASSFSSKPAGLFPSSSNVSTATVQTVDTDLTAATSPEQFNSLAKKTIELQQEQSQRPHTPGLTDGSKDGGSEQISTASTSPISVDTPYLNKGSKRTASGAIKSSMSIQTAVGATGANESAVSPVGKSPKEMAQVCISPFAQHNPYQIKKAPKSRSCLFCYFGFPHVSFAMAVEHIMRASEDDLRRKSRTVNWMTFNR